MDRHTWAWITRPGPTTKEPKYAGSTTLFTQLDNPGTCHTAGFPLGARLPEHAGSWVEHEQRVPINHDFNVDKNKGCTSSYNEKTKKTGEYEEMETRSKDNLAAAGGTNEVLLHSRRVLKQMAISSIVGGHRPNIRRGMVPQAMTQ